ncbi:MAG TPA: BatD family protein, partial [Bacteroidia bacterium]|nr:BatD family protein [Bacteroidia bacterium]
TLLITSPVPIEVSDIPDKNKPADFQGDVGEFSLNSSIDHARVKANEPVILNVSINGKGNIDFIRFPATKFPDGIESFPPSSSDTITQTWDGITGEKKFRITLIPKNAGNFTIPGISFSYYDPEKKDFVTLKTPEFELKVDPADVSKDVTENNLPESFLDTRSYGKIIRRILLIIVPPMLLILALFFISRKKKKKEQTQEDALLKKTEEENEEHVVAAKKSSDIQGMINTAESLIISGKTKAGIAQLYETLYTALCEKTELTREEASYHQMRFRLEIKHYPKEFAAEILGLLQELSELRYADDPVNAVKLAENIQNTRKLTLRLV